MCSGAVAISLPNLESARAQGLQQPPAVSSSPPPNALKKRLVLIGTPLGFHSPYFLPTQAGPNYTPSLYFEKFDPKLRNLFSIVSGLHHPDVENGHVADACFLTGAPHPARSGFKNTISIDQYAARFIGDQTRFDSLPLTLNRGGISYGRGGAKLPAEDSPAELYKRLFLDGSGDAKQLQMDRIADGQSILDVVGNQLNSIHKNASSKDRQILDQYASSIRELEVQISKRKNWIQRPKPQVEAASPPAVKEQSQVHVRLQQMYDLMFLALQTDSTRLITLAGPGGGTVVSLPGIKHGWHQLSHHGKDPAKIAELAIIEQMQLDLYVKFIERLAGTHDGESNLLDQTVVMMGSSLGNASSHSVKNLPIIVAGGGFQHGQHFAFDPENSPPLCNLFVSMLQHLGIETDRFSSGFGTLAGFEV